MDKTETLREYIKSAQNIVFFGGAGVSTESGIPDFRSVDGLYHQQFDDPPETVLSHRYFFAHTEKFFKFYKSKMLCEGVKPNAAHIALARLEEQKKLTAVITQNIDGLHQLAGSKCVYELHGSVKRNYCLKCGKFYDDKYILHSDGVPKCECSGIIKPDVVLYEEPLDDATVLGAVKAIQGADLLIVAGTSLTVYPAAGLLRYFNGKHIVLINRDETSLDYRADLVIREKVGEVLSRVVE